MAGAGYKIFQDEDVLFASDLMNYVLDQVVMVFDDSADRTAQLTSPTEGMIAYTKDDDTLRFFNGSAWLTVANPGTITGVTAGTGLKGGGTSGTVTVDIDALTNIRTFSAATNGGLSVNSNVGAVSASLAVSNVGDLIVGTGPNTVAVLPKGTGSQRLIVTGETETNLTWIDDTWNTVVNAKGDLLVGTADNTLTRLAVGSYPQVLIADSTQTSGLKWENISTLPVVVSTQSTTSKTLALSDAGTLIAMTGANTTITVPAAGSVDFSIGTQITFLQDAAGVVQFQAASGVTIKATPGLKLRTQNSVATLIKQGSNTWILFGDLVA
jgi:hypothetical protein